MCTRLLFDSVQFAGITLESFTTRQSPHAGTLEYRRNVYALSGLALSSTISLHSILFSEGVQLSEARNQNLLVSFLFYILQFLISEARLLIHI